MSSPWRTVIEQSNWSAFQFRLMTRMTTLSRRSPDPSLGGQLQRHPRAPPRSIHPRPSQNCPKMACKVKAPIGMTIDSRSPIRDRATDRCATPWELGARRLTVIIRNTIPIARAAMLANPRINAIPPESAQQPEALEHPMLPPKPSGLLMPRA